MDYGVLTDARYMLMAVDGAISGLQKHDATYGGQVGSILIGPEGNIISQAHNDLLGGIRKHAEEVVLEMAKGADLSDATLYVTMEPCNGNPYHERRHCCKQIADAGVGRIVIGAPKIVYEGGADYMKEQGIQVDFLESGDLGNLCRLLIANKESGAGLSKRVVRKILNTRDQIGKLSWADGLQ